MDDASDPGQEGPPLFLALLSNGSNDLLGLSLGELTINRKLKSRVVRLIAELHDFSEYEFPFLLEDHYQCTDSSGRFVYTIEGPAPQLDKDTASKDNMALHRMHEAFVTDLERRIKLMRLFGEGSLKIPIWFFYDPVERTPEYFAIGYDFIKPHRYTLDKEWAGTLRTMVARGDLETSQLYVRLAWEVLDESYDQDSRKLELLSLITATEVLFNDGQGELRFRIARAVAVLLGRTLNESQQIFGRMKAFYDKRSLVVHTGQCKSLLAGEIVELRRLVRHAIIKLAEVDVSKAALAEILTQSGFGTSRSTIQRMRSERP